MLISPELEPQFYSDATSFRVTLYNLNYQEPIVEFESLETAFSRLLEYQNRLLAYQKQLFEDSKTVVSEGKQLFGDSKTVVSEEKQLFEDSKTVVSEEKQLFEDEKTVVSKEKQLFDQTLNELNVSLNTKEKIMQLYQHFSNELFFSRADVMRITGITSSPAGDLINKMKNAHLIEPVTGHGKGRYRFIL